MMVDTDGREHFVYRVFDSAGDLLYVGMTALPHERFRNHKNRTSWYPLAARVDWECVGPNRLLAESAEAEAIRTEHPRFNQRMAANVLFPVELAGLAARVQKAVDRDNTTRGAA